MTSNQLQSLIRQALFWSFMWALPLVIAILLILQPGLISRQPLWNSPIADWFFRVFITLVFSSWHRTHAKVFAQSNRVVDVEGLQPLPTQVAVTNALVATVILTSQILVGSLVIAYFTWFAVVAFVPWLETWWMVIVVIHVCLVILPWLFYRRIDAARQQTPGSPSE